MSQNHKNNLCLTLAMLYLILIGALARFYQLGWHFTHADDIGVVKTLFDAMQVGVSPFWVVPQTWTYAPLQFLITPLLVHLDQSYRDFLFWGRLPSCLFSILSLCLVPIFFRILKSKKDIQMLIMLTLMVCSWEHLIHAKQMHNYSFAVLGLMSMLCLWGALLKPENMKVKIAFLVGLSLAVCSMVSYQLLWFYPAFFASLFFYYLLSKKMSLRIFIFFILAGILLVAFVFPIYWFFLKKMLSVSHAGMTWNTGPNNEFVFSLEGLKGLQLVSYTINYYLTNILLVLQNNLAFVKPQSLFLIPIVYYGFGFFFFVGLVRLLLSQDKKDKALLLFVLLTALTWVALIALQKTTLSPTRHNLILLPLFAFLVAEGMTFSALQLESMVGRKDLSSKLIFISLAVIVSLWLFDLPSFFKERKDPFSESEMKQLIYEYQPDTILAIDHTMNVGQMKFVRDYYHYYAPGYVMGHEVIAKGMPAYDTILWVSHRTPLNAKEWHLMLMTKINPYLQIRNMLRQRKGRQPLPYFQVPFQNYEIIYRKEMNSTTEVDYSTRTENGTNALYMYVLKRKG